MTLTIPIPDNLDSATVNELDHAARELVGVRLYQQGKLSHGKLAKFLGVGRGQVDDILSRYGVVDMTPEELDKESESNGRSGA